MSALPSRSRRKIYKRLAGFYGDCCYYCQRQFFGFGKRQRTIDHLTPLSRAGTNELSNLVLACSRCNHLKGDMTWLEFIASERYGERRQSAMTEENRKVRPRIEVLTRLDAPILAGIAG